ncbi:MAG: c-type cytochrome [Terriglobales bacterium]
MRAFILGVIFTIVVIFVVVLLVAQFGLFPTNADATPSAMERHIAMSALDASMERHAPQIPNPVPVTDNNLIDAIKLYTMNCAVCHGTLDYKPSVLEHSMYPPPPQVILDPMDDPEWHIFYAIRTGVRYTGMPAWGHALSEQDIWKLTAFLSRLDKLPPAVQQYWKTNFGVSPQNHPGNGGHEHHD